MNDDRLDEWERCASTSNRNFEGRQSRNGRTHLVSPAMTAAAGMFGKFVDIREVALKLKLKKRKKKMAGFKQLSGLVVPLDAANVDTDAIIPKQFLQAITA